MAEAELGNKDPNAIENFSASIDRQELGELEGISAPWPLTNKFLGRLGPGEVTVFAGTEGAGKTWFIVELMAHAHDLGKKWAYMPLEGDMNSYMRRFLAHKARDWSVNDTGRESAAAARDAMSKHGSWLNDVRKRIYKNPRLPSGNAAFGDISAVPDIPYTRMIDWVAKSAIVRDLVVIDPITMLDFDIDEHGNKINTYEGQNDFIKRLVATIAGKKCHVVIVLHYSKGTNNVQGGADCTRFAHNVIKLNIHDEIDSLVMTQSAYSDELIEMEVAHKRTFRISKTRNGKGNKIDVAVELGPSGPKIDEIGVIAKRKKGR